MEFYFHLLGMYNKTFCLSRYLLHILTHILRVALEEWSKNLVLASVTFARNSVMTLILATSTFTTECKREARKISHIFVH